MNEAMRRFADMAFCINLDRRRDRWQHMRRQFHRHGLQVSRFAAIDGAQFPPAVKIPKPRLYLPFLAGTYASLLSHLTVIQMAKEMKLKGVWIWEDDCLIHPHFGPWVSEFLGNVPDDWDMLYWGGRVLLGKSPIAGAGRGAVYRPDYIYWTISYIIRDTAYDACIGALRAKNHWADQLLAGLGPQLNVYTPFPRPVRQSFKMGSDNKTMPPPQPQPQGVSDVSDDQSDRDGAVQAVRDGGVPPLSGHEREPGNGGAAPGAGGEP